MALEAVAQLGIPGGVELLVVLLIAVLLFGANKIPKLARASGRAIGEFQKGRDELQEELTGDDDDDEEAVVEPGDEIGGGDADSDEDEDEELDTETA